MPPPCLTVSKTIAEPSRDLLEEPAGDSAVLPEFAVAPPLDCFTNRFGESLGVGFATKVAGP